MHDGDEHVTYVFFDGYRLNLASGDLIGPSGPVAIQPLPARVLCELAAHPGELVEREHLKQSIWGRSTFSADQALNTSIRQLRRTLGDDASRPRYIATVPRRGYRFVGEVEEGAAGSPAGRVASEVTVGREASMGSPRWIVPIGGALAAALLLTTFWPRTSSVPPGSAPVDAATSLAARQAAEADELPDALRMEYLKGRRLLDSQDRAGWSRARKAFSIVREARPYFVPAVSGEAGAAMRLGDHATAAGLATWAIAADSSRAEAHMVLAYTLLARGDLVHARRSFEYALSHEPELIGAYPGLATVEVLEGRYAQAIHLAKTSLKIDPVSAVTAGDAGYVANWSGRPDLAIEWCRHAVEIDPTAHAPRYCILDANHARGDVDAARASALDILDLLEAPRDLLAEVRRQSAAEGLDTYLRWQIDRLDPTGEAPVSMAVPLATLYAQASDYDAALRHLALAASHGDRNLVFVLPDRAFDPIRGDERFVSIVESIVG